jgi:hypothetical protein
MKGKKRVYIILFFISFFIMTSCATTTLNTVWKDDSYQGRITNILVMGISKQQVRKRFFEDEFVRQLQDHGLSATSSYRIFPSERMLEKDMVLSKIRGMGIDTFLITRMVDKKTVETYVPGKVVHYAPPRTHRSWHGYYAGSYGAIYEPGYTIKDEVVVLETNLYDAESEELIWTALSETVKEGPEERVIKNFIKLIMKNLSEKNLIK